MSVLRVRLLLLGLAVILTIGAAVAWGAIVGFPLAIGDAVLRREWMSERLTVREDGTPLVAVVSAGNWAQPTYRTLDGEPLPETHSKLLPGVLLAGTRGWRGWRETAGRLEWSLRISMVEAAEPLPVTVWYFIHDGQRQGHGYFVGYSTATNRPIEYLDRHGFQRELPDKDTWFAIDSRKMSSGRALVNYSGEVLKNPGREEERGGTYLLADDGFYQIDFRRHAVKLLRSDPDIISVSRTPWPGRIKQREPSWPLVVRKPDQILLLARDGKPLASYPISLPEEMETGYIYWYHLPDDRSVVYVYPNGSELFWFDARGDVVRRQHVSLWQQRSMFVPEVLAVSATFPSPGLLTGARLASPWENPYRPRSVPYPAAVRDALRQWGAALVALWALSAVLAWRCWRRQRDYGLPWTVVFVGLVFLFGVPMYLGYLVHRRWPVLLPCPHCTQPTPRDRSTCLACGQPFPRPAWRGIEVFSTAENDL